MGRWTVDRMRAYWDDAARRNAAWYVDTSLGFDEPDMERFFATGEEIARIAHRDAPVQASGRQRALEIGCGLGRVCRALAADFEQVDGIDISEEMLARARELVTDDRVRFHHGDGESLAGIEDASVDLVVSFTVFQHIPEPAVIARYVAEAGRVLRPGGVLSFQWNNQAGPWRWRARRAVLDALQRSGLRPERHGRNAAEFLGSRVPLRRVRAMLDDAGLELAATTGEGTLYAWAWATKPVPESPGRADR
jgi:SAM-dependent methyltransferase